MRIALPAAMERRGPPQGPAIGLAGETMGTSWSVRYAAPRLDPAHVREAIWARLDALNGELSHWAPESDLCRFNRAPAGQWVSLPPDLATVIAAGLEMASLSDGAFDPAIGRVVDLLGFGPPGPQPAPDPALLADALAKGGARNLDWDPAARRLRQPGGLALDLSGIAKGYAVDALGDLLDGLGAQDWLVEIGGELKGRGMRPDGDPWWVDLEPLAGETEPPIRIALHGLAVATSGDYRKGAHTIDPRTARSVTNGIRQVSVIHPSAMWADAWATAITVLGVEDGMRLAEREGIAARVVSEDARLLHESISSALQTML